MCAQVHIRPFVRHLFTVIVPIIVLLFAQRPCAAEEAISGNEIVVTTRQNNQLQPSIANNPQVGEFLVVWEDHQENPSIAAIRGQRLEHNGATRGDVLAISITTARSQEAPAVACQPDTGECLVVWEDHSSFTQRTIVARRTDSGGNPSGDIVSLSQLGLNASQPAIAADPSSGGYLVVWEQGPFVGPHDIVARRVGANASPIDAAFFVDNGAGDQLQPALAYAPESALYLVTYSDNDAAADYDLHARRVSDDGQLLGSEISIIAWQYDQLASQVVFNERRDEFFVVWEDHHWGWGGDADIYSMRYTTAGAAVGSLTGIAWDGDYRRLTPDVAYLDDADEYYVVWDRTYAADDVIYHNSAGRRVGATGALYSDETLLADNPTREAAPVIAPNAVDGYLAVWEDGRNSASQGTNLYGRLLMLRSDLSLSGFTLSPQVVHAGEPTSAAITVHNSGPLPLSNIVVQLSVEGQVVADTTISTLQPASEAKASASFSLPNTGQFVIVAEVNPGGVLPEADLANNRVSQTLDVVWEKDPLWARPDIVLSDPSATPGRPQPGQPVQVTAILKNNSATALSNVTVELWVDSQPALTLMVSNLAGSAEQPVAFSWNGASPGRHLLTIVADPQVALKERDTTNNRVDMWLRVAGEAAPLPDLELTSVQMSPATPLVGTSATLQIVITNEGYRDALNLPVVIEMGTEELNRQVIPLLAAGASSTLAVPWPVVGEGIHQLRVHLDPDDVVLDNSLQTSWVTALHIPATTHYHTAPAQSTGRWVFRGPSTLHNGAFVGRIDSIDVGGPTGNHLLVGAVKGGVWLSRDGGKSWRNLGDRLPTPRYSTVAFDPTDWDILYAGSGSHYGDGTGLYKSIDGGAHWTNFAERHRAEPSRGYRGLIVRHFQPGTATIFAAATNGLWHWEGDPHALTTDPNDWQRIWPTTAITQTKVTDILISHENPPRVYWAVDETGVFGVDAVNARTAPVQQLSSAFPTEDVGFITIGSSPARPDRLYAAVIRGHETLDIFRSDSGGPWEKRGRVTGNCAADNNFVGVHPMNANMLYIGSVKGCRSSDGGASFDYRIPDAVHDDYKAIAFAPLDPSIVYFTSDGGVYECTNNSDLMKCNGLNEGLDVTQFYDIATTPANPQRILGGTQDNGNVWTDGDLRWNWTHVTSGGDGKYVAIDPANAAIFYAQHQYVDDLDRSEDSGATWTRAASGLPAIDAGDPYLAINPDDGKTLLTVYDQVYRTTNSGASWQEIGPILASTAISISRVTFDATHQRYFAGTTNGDIWMVAAASASASNWQQIYTHSSASAVVGLLVSDDEQDTLYATFAGIGADRVARLRYNGTHDRWDANYLGALAGDRSIDSGQMANPRGLAKQPGENVLFVGTDRGVYRGELAADGVTWRWSADSCGLPATSVSDLELRPGGASLLASTFGRGVWEQSFANVPADTYDVSQRNDSAATATVVAAPLQESLVPPSAVLTNLTLDRLEDVDYYRFQLPAATARSCLPPNDPQLSEGAFQCVLQIVLLAPDTPEPFELFVENSGGHPIIREEMESSYFGVTLPRPYDSFADDLFFVRVRHPEGCRARYELQVRYSNWYEIEIPELPWSDKYIALPALNDFDWVYPVSPEAINRGFDHPDQLVLPPQHAIFQWRQTGDLQVNVSTLGTGKVKAVLESLDGTRQIAAVQAAARSGPDIISAPSLAPGWYALTLSDGDFPTFVHVEFVGADERVYLPLIVR